MLELVIRTRNDVVVTYVAESTTKYTLDCIVQFFRTEAEMSASYTSIDIVTESTGDAQLKYFNPIKFCCEIIDEKLNSWVCKMRTECEINEEYFNFIANQVKSLRDDADRINKATDIEKANKNIYLANFLTKKVLIESIDALRCRSSRMHNLVFDELHLANPDDYSDYLSKE